MKRTLSLRRENLIELTSDDLGAVAGGAGSLLDCSKTLRDCALPTFQYSCLNCISHPPCITDVTTR